MAKSNEEQENSNKVAEKNFEPSDYQNTSEVSKGLAITHEQVNDTNFEGTIDGVMEDVDGEDIPLKREGFNE
jgi:hypothetical protein